MARPLRSDNRLPQILDEAARLFREKGYQATTVRDIVGAVNMLPGSLYYHFPGKEDLLVAVYAEGVRRISEGVRAAIAGKREPWRRLEAACGAHLDALLQESDYAQVAIRVRPDDVPGAAARLIALRDEYEKMFAGLIDELVLPPGADRRSLRLMLLGALNWAQTWYREGGETPRDIARRFVGLLRDRLG